MVASALQIAQAALLAAHDSRSTLFLIDDAGAELDAEHNERLFGLLARIGSQILATTTRRPAPGDVLAGGSGLDATRSAGSKTSRVFHVKQGTVQGE